MSSIFSRMNVILFFCLMAIWRCSLASIQLVSSGPGTLKPGETLRMVCKVTGTSIAASSNIWAWIRQPPGKGLQWIARIYSYDGRVWYDSSLQSRTSISSDTSKSEFYLQLTSVAVADSAVYYCVRDPFDYWGEGTMVTVTSASLSAPTLFPLIPFGSIRDSGYVTVGCLAKDFLPDSITFSWSDQSNASLEANKFMKYPSVFNSDGKFMASTQASVPEAEWKSSNIFYCKAKHVDVERVARVTPCSTEAPISPEMIIRAPPPEAFQSAYLNSTISCTATHLNRGKTILQWFKDGEELDSGFTTGKPCFDVHSGNSITSELVVTKKDWFADKKFSCKVENGKYNNTLAIRKSAYGQGPVSCDDVQVETIPPTYAEIHLKQQATLTCRVSNIPYDVDLAALNVTWTQKPGGIVLPTVIGKSQEQENDKQTIDATATVCTTNWNILNVFTCKVSFAGLLPIPIEKTLEKPRGGSISPPTVYILPPPPEELALRETATLTCMVKNFSPQDFFLQWLHGDQPVSPEHYFTSTPRKESKRPERYSAYSTLSISEHDWNSGSSYSCLVGHEGLPLSTTQKTIDKNAGKPSIVNVSLVLSNAVDTCY